MGGTPNSEKEIINLLVNVVSLTVISIVGATLPIVFKSIGSIMNLLDCINSSVTGLSMALVFVDIIPDLAAISMPKDNHSHHNHGGCSHSSIDRKGFTIAGGTLIFLLFVEVIIHHFIHYLQQNKKKTKEIDEHADHFVETNIPRDENSIEGGCDHSSHSHHTHFDNKEEISNDLHDHLEENHDGGHCNHSQEILKVDGLMKYFMLFGLSLHSFLEGLEHGVHSGGLHFAALAFHKFFESFSVGMTLFYNKINSITSSVIICLFCSLTPIAMILGHLFHSFSNSSNITMVFKALALGSLSYVIFLESMPNIMHGKDQIIKLISLTFGFVLGAFMIVSVH